METLRGSSNSLAASRRGYVEALARRFQERTLIATIEARLSLKRGDAGRDSCDTAKAELEKIREEIDGSTDIPVNIKYDLLADS